MKNEELPKTIPVFPLSNFIIFPKTTVPLNIFEPRYIDMINDSMKSNKFIGMIQPKTSIDDKNRPELQYDSPFLSVRRYGHGIKDTLKFYAFYNMKRKQPAYFPD